MIIACPDCESPFELRDENIAALVQLECPSCSFRMILDFAAANDASLVEDGMKMAGCSSKLAGCLKTPPMWQAALSCKLPP